MKKILVALLMMAPMSLFAQKFAHFDSSLVYPEMEEFKTAKGELDKIQTQYQEEMERLQNEYKTKVEEFQKLSENGQTEQVILQNKAGDLEKMEQSIQNFYQAIQQDMQKQQETKMEPIRAKIQAAIKKIGEAGNYIYVIDTSVGAVTWINEALSTDITAQIRTEVGIK